MSFFKKFWEKITFSPLLQGKTRSRQIAYLGLLTAVSVVANSFFEIKLGVIQYSLTIAVCAFTGILIGAGYGFVVCFLGDLIGFIMHPSGVYLPWIGLAMGGTAFFAGMLINLEKKQKTDVLLYRLESFLGIPCFLLSERLINRGKKTKKKALYRLESFLGIPYFLDVEKSERWGRYALMGLVCLLSFVVCSVGITHTAFFFLYAGGRSYWGFFIYRFFTQGQLFNCLFNYALCFLGLPLLKKILSLK